MKYTHEQLKIFTGKKVAIIGAGLEGISTAEFLHKFGTSITFFDQKEQREINDETLAKIVSLGEVIAGKDAFSEVKGFDLIVRSPGIHKDLQFLKDAVEQGAIVTSQTQLFFDLCPSSIIGVTGTKGKGTTSSLIYHMLKEAGRDVYLGGNIGVPPLTFIDQLQESSVVVLELSSFQLQDVTKSPHIAVMLMVVPEHLDYHQSPDEYIDAKRNIFRFQTKDDFAVINRDYIASNESDIYTDGQVYWVSRERTTTEQGCFIKDGGVWMYMQGSEWKIIDIEKITLPGKHNLENVCASVAAATLAGAAKADIIKVLSEFKGLEHRLELVREIGGVRYYDDSFSTTPETAIAAIQAFKDPEIVILGGSSKQSDFTELGNIIVASENIKTIIGIGQEWERIKKSIHGLPEHVLLLEGAKDMATVVQAANAIARPGDVVLFSPGCASFDMFENYKERGNSFKKEVEKL